MSKITSITSSDEWNVVSYDDGTAVLVRRILSSAGDNPLTTHEQMVEESREKLAQAERERDEARAMAYLADKQRNAATADFSSALQKMARERDDVRERLEQATALLREALRFLADCANEEIDTPPDLRLRIEDLPDGQPAPAKVAVDDAMVARAMKAWIVAEPSIRPTVRAVRALLVAALEGKK